MPRPAGALAVGLATAAFALAFVAPSPVEAQSPVTVDLTCPADDSGELVVKVKPWVYEVDLDTTQVGEWVLNVDADIEIAAKKPGRWPWKKEKLKDKKKVKMKEWKTGIKKGDEFDYSITVYCGEHFVLVDPRVRVR